MKVDRGDTFQCAECGGIFVAERTEAEAAAEAEANFGEIPDDERAVVCDDCYNSLMAAIARGGVQ